MIGYATITFSNDKAGHINCPLTVWITKIKTQSFLETDFCQKEISGIPFDLPGIKTENPPKSIRNGSFHQNKL